MSISDADIAFVKDLFSGVGTLTTRKMFGGLAVYADGVIFALDHQHGRFDDQGKGRACKRPRRPRIAAIYS